MRTVLFQAFLRLTILPYRVVLTTAADRQNLHLTAICRPKKTGESGLKANKNEKKRKVKPTKKAEKSLGIMRFQGFPYVACTISRYNLTA